MHAYGRIGMIACGLLIVVSTSTPAAAEESKLTFGGYVKFDAMFSEYSAGAPADGSVLRDFHLPGAIPVGGTSSDSSTDFHAKESRFNVAFERQTDDDHRLKAFFEVDFLLSAAGDERVSNSYNPRLRHAYVSFDRWLFGQTWSTFMIVVLPEDLDFVGASDGTTFRRGPQIRLTHGAWQFALENPETTITPNGGGTRITADDSLLPDLVVRYNRSRDHGTISIAGIVRRLELDQALGDATETGWGVSLGGRWRAAADDELIFQFTTGSGLGRHLALNTANAAVIDAGGALQPIDSSAGFVGLRHAWSDRWRSNLNVSAFRADQQPALTGPAATERARSVSINALYSPVPQLTLGAEYMHAEREIVSGADGDLDRIQFSAKYAFKVSPVLRSADGS